MKRFFLSLLFVALPLMHGYTALAKEAPKAHTLAIETNSGFHMGLLQLAVGSAAHAQDVAAPAPADPSQQVSDGDFFSSLAKAISDIDKVMKSDNTAGKLAMVLAIILIIAQLLVQFTKTPLFGRLFTKVDDLGKQIIVTICTTVVTVIGLMQSGLSFGQSILAGPVISLVMIGGHQIYKKFFEKKPAV